MSANSHKQTFGEMGGLCRVTSIIGDVLSQRQALQASTRFVAVKTASAVHSRLCAAIYRGEA
jgi:hypothetical protein